MTQIQNVWIQNVFLQLYQTPGIKCTRFYYNTTLLH